MVVYGRLGHRATILLDDLLRLPAFEIIPPGPAEMEAAWGVFIAYGVCHPEMAEAGQGAERGGDLGFDLEAVAERSGG